MVSASKHSENGSIQPPPSRLDNLEQGAKIFATAMIPIIVAFGGWMIERSIEHDRENAALVQQQAQDAAAKVQQDQQSSLEKEKISLEYVKIAKDILVSTEKDIPAELTKWSWELLNGVSPVKFDEDDLKRLIERKDRIPAPVIPSGSSPTSFESLAPEYDQMFKDVRLTLNNERLDTVIERIAANKARYVALQTTTGVPWFVVGVVHYLESDLDFTVHLHNGDPLAARTVHAPVGRPKNGQPPFSWEDSAQDAFELSGTNTVRDWSIVRILYELERYNGLGYRRRQINTPFLWNCTSNYAQGLFNPVGVFDPNLVAAKCGGAALLKRMMDRRLIALN
jgi:lysozyme family protein